MGVSRGHWVGDRNVPRMASGADVEVAVDECIGLQGDPGLQTRANESSFPPLTPCAS